MHESLRAKCPCCGSALRPRDIDIFQPFRCRICNNWVHASKWYVPVRGLISLIISTALAYDLGFRNLATLPVASLLILIPVILIIIFASNRILPPRLHPYDHGR